VVLRKLTNCTPIVGFSRPDYFSAWVVKADSGINRLSDLKGKKVAMSDIGSTSGHLGPAQAMKDGGLDPLKDIQAIHTSKEIAWESLKKGDVAAWGYNATSFMRFRDKDKTVNPGAFKTIARGPDLPSDVLVAGTHVDKKISDSIVKAITENSDQLIAEILKGRGQQEIQRHAVPGQHQGRRLQLRPRHVPHHRPAQFSEFVGRIAMTTGAVATFHQGHRYAGADSRAGPGRQNPPILKSPDCASPLTGNGRSCGTSISRSRRGRRSL
jgi:hypothetical protein